jgi:hypothetical protein
MQGEAGCFSGIFVLVMDCFLVYSKRHCKCRV